MYGMKMFQSVFDVEDIFEEWNWNLEVVIPYENYFEEWLWNFENPKEADAIKSKFYDTTGVLNEWNDYNFWNNVGQSMDDIEIQLDGILNDIENQVDDNNDWMNWHYWDNWGSNQAILKALEETADCEAGTLINFGKIRKIIMTLLLHCFKISIRETWRIQRMRMTRNQLTGIVCCFGTIQAKMKKF